MDVGDYLAIRDSALDVDGAVCQVKSTGERVYETPEPQVTPEQPVVYDTLQLETREGTENDASNQRKSNRIVIIVMVVIIVIMSAAIGAGVGWYFGSQKSTMDGS